MSHNCLSFDIYTDTIRITSNSICQLKTGPTGRKPSVGGLSVGILTHIYASFGENHGKHRTSKSTSVTGV